MSWKDWLAVLALIAVIAAVCWWANTRGDETANPDDPGDDPGPF